MNNPDSNDKTHKRYDEAFKRSVIEHWMLSGKSVRQIAGELGVYIQTSHSWKQKFKELPAGRVAGCWQSKYHDTIEPVVKRRIINRSRDMVGGPSRNFHQGIPIGRVQGFAELNRVDPIRDRLKTEVNRSVRCDAGDPQTTLAVVRISARNLSNHVLTTKWIRNAEGAFGVILPLSVHQETVVICARLQCDASLPYPVRAWWRRIGDLNEWVKSPTNWTLTAP